ncbi:uncharacterized protein LOC124885297 [Capsicum annuum]|uniref:uncharacterized protein LOC124885297 n=1 Tax=Capsicum annuum TaxID=4072 RepID=UPI001FB1280D|nr:uncharacterized protein LOC124885297 [Capsicum annuum]
MVTTTDGSTNQDDDDAIIGVAATSILVAWVAIIVAYEHESSIPREPYVNKDQEREFYMNSILNGSDVHSVGQIRMSKHAFYELCNALRRNSFLCSTKNMSVQEQVNRVYSSMLPHHASSSFEALSNPYKITGWNRPTGDNEQPSILSLVYRAKDGTHVLASIPIEQQNRFHGRKGTTTQNVLAVINFNLKFMYVLAGWEGSTHDSRILNDTLKRPHGLQISQDKYYLVDVGYRLHKGFIPPYHGIRYHLQKYSDCSPQNERELFNLHRASLRSSVEHAFDILKRRFRVIDNEHFWDFKTQVNVALASCILHNHIVDSEPNDIIIQEVDVEAVIQLQNAQITQNSQGSQSYQTQRERREEARQRSSKRDAIAHAMFVNYDR